MVRSILIITFCLLLSVINAQKIKGTVTDDKGVVLPGVNIVVKGTKSGVETDIDGNYQIKLKQKGNYTLQVSFIGFKTAFKSVTLIENETKVVNFKIKEEAYNLDVVQITGKTKSQIVRELSYAVEAIPMKGLKNLSTDANAVLAKVSGVNIRQSGGLGSDFSVSLNGFYGSQVRVFIDGIPMHYFGTSLSLNNFPTNLIEQVEVYKGVVPIHLSSDALGGAINVTTNKSQNSFLDAAYSVGSFNTHRFSVNGQYRSENGFTTRLKSFYNYTDNNYKVPLEYDPLTGDELKNKIEVQRFHDAYNSQMIWTEFGLTGVRFADELMAGIMFSENYKEIQQSPYQIGQGNDPFGEVDKQENKIITNFSFRKKNIIDKLSSSVYFVGVFSDNAFTDISDYKYNWYGGKRFIPDNTRGEFRYEKSALNLNEHNYLANVNSEYSFSSKMSIAANYNYSFYKIKGADKYRKSNQVQFSNPNKFNKQIISLSFTKGIGENFKSSVFGKYFIYDVNSTKTDTFGETKLPVQELKEDFGYGFTVSHQLGDFQLKASYEKALRLPESIELFGNGVEIISNPSLNLEKSNNFNLGFLLKKSIINHNFLVSVNSFLRDGENFINPRSVQATSIKYLNTKKALTKGVDFAASYEYKGSLLFNFSGSYYKKLDKVKWEDDTRRRPNTTYNLRFPNEPYLFGNFTFSYKKKDFFYSNDSFVASLRQSYVHDFYYKWENLGAVGKQKVPAQFTTDLELVYSLQQQKYNISLGVTNLWDKEVYDNFKQAKPGRAASLKFRYFIN